jgi:hypothetical protein
MRYNKDKIQNTTIGLLVIILLLITLPMLVPRQLAIQPVQTKQTTNENTYQVLHMPAIAQQLKQDAQTIEVEMPKYDIPMDLELQKYTYDLSNQYELSYEMILALLYGESHMNPEAVNVNKKSIDKGIAQINSTNFIKFASRSGISNFNPMNPYHSIKVCIEHLYDLKQNWIQRGVTDEETLWYMVLNSYNMGEPNYITYLQDGNPMSRGYDRKISRYKEMLETEGALHD